MPPYKYQLENPENTNQPQILLKNFAKDNNLLFLDLLDLFYLNKQIYNSSLFDDASHFSTKGHILAATFLTNETINIIN